MNAAAVTGAQARSPYHPQSHAAAHPLYREPVRMEAARLAANPDTATAQTVAVMARLARADAQSPVVKRLARSLTGTTEQETIDRIFQHVHRTMRFQTDPRTVAPLANGRPLPIEVLQRPVDVLRQFRPTGDCDDYAMLTAALLEAAGIPAAFETSASMEGSQAFSHVYAVALTPKGPVSMDTSHTDRPGARVPASRRRLFPLRAAPGLGFANVPAVPQPAAPGPWWSSAIQAGTDIARARYGNPPAGVSIQQTAGGSIYTRQDPRAPFTFPGPSVGINDSFGWIIGLAALGLVGLAIFKR